MSENEESSTRFLGTYFNHDNVLKVSRWADILSWVVVGIYVLDMVVAVGVYILQFARGFMVGIGFTDIVTNILYLAERPFRGIVYFVVLQAISKALLLLMDMEESLRRAARK